MIAVIGGCADTTSAVLVLTLLLRWANIPLALGAEKRFKNIPLKFKLAKNCTKMCRNLAKRARMSLQFNVMHNAIDGQSLTVEH